MTSKGKLIRAILFPKPIHFRFYADLVKAAGLFLNRQQTEWTTNNMNKQNEWRWILKSHGVAFRRWLVMRWKSNRNWPVYWSCGINWKGRRFRRSASWKKPPFGRWWVTGDNLKTTVTVKRLSKDCQMIDTVQQVESFRWKLQLYLPQITVPSIPQSPLQRSPNQIYRNLPMEPFVNCLFSIHS